MRDIERKNIYVCARDSAQNERENTHLIWVKRKWYGLSQASDWFESRTKKIIKLHHWFESLDLSQTNLWFESWIHNQNPKHACNFLFESCYFVIWIKTSMIRVKFLYDLNRKYISKILFEVSIFDLGQTISCFRIKKYIIKIWFSHQFLIRVNQFYDSNHTSKFSKFKKSEMFVWIETLWDLNHAFMCFLIQISS